MGLYNSLYDCLQSPSCFVPETWNCVNGSCVDPGDGNGIYNSLFECEQSDPCSIESWDCINGNCLDPGDGTGIYSSFENCQTVCSTNNLSLIHI